MTQVNAEDVRAPSRWRLQSEFLLVFVVAPLVMAFLLPPERMFPMLFGVTAIGIGLLQMTQSFLWRDLLEGRDRIIWRKVWGIGLLVLAFGAALLWSTRPDALFALARHQPMLMATILLLYPVLSALPQELVYRVLFFRRYAPLLPGDRRMAILLNATLFSLAHLMYWSWLVLFMTFLGGLAFAWAYEVRRSFTMAWILHAVAGNLIFLVGLGLYFYSGNVVRPF